MPSAALAYCLGRPGRPCSARVKGGRCTRCAPKAFAGHNQDRHARGYGSAWEATRARVLREESSCIECGGPARADDQVDHRKPKHLGGTDDRANLGRIHVDPCHRAKTRREAGAARSRRAAEARR
jgi:5-methylcytosine-specific restriction enzyme A